MWTALRFLAELHEVRPMSSDCTCGSVRHDHTRAFAYREGWFVECLNCGSTWVEFQLTERLSSGACTGPAAGR